MSQDKGEEEGDDDDEEEEEEEEDDEEMEDASDEEGGQGSLLGVGFSRVPRIWVPESESGA